MVAFFEALIAADGPTLRQLETFLGVRFPEGPPPRMNPGGRAKSPVMAALINNAKLRGRLKRFIPLKQRTRLGQLVRNSVADREARARPGHRRRAPPPLCRGCCPARGADRPADGLAGRLRGQVLRMFRARNTRRRPPGGGGRRGRVGCARGTRRGGRRVRVTRCGVGRGAWQAADDSCRESRGSRCGGGGEGGGGRVGGVGRFVREVVVVEGVGVGRDEGEEGGGGGYRRVGAALREA